MSELDIASNVVAALANLSRPTIQALEQIERALAEGNRKQDFAIQQNKEILRQMQVDDTQFKALTDGITQMATDQQASNQTILTDVQEIAAKLTAATGTPTDISGTIAAITASDQAAKDVAAQVDAIVNPAS